MDNSHSLKSRLLKKQEKKPRVDLNKAFYFPIPSEPTSSSSSSEVSSTADESYDFEPSSETSRRTSNQNLGSEIQLEAQKDDSYDDYVNIDEFYRLYTQVLPLDSIQSSEWRQPVYTLEEMKRRILSEHDDAVTSDSTIERKLAQLMNYLKKKKSIFQLKLCF